MASSSSPLNDFVNRVQNDPEYHAQYKADPAGTMTAAGLSDDDQKVVASNDPAQIAGAIEQQTGLKAPLRDCWG